MRYVLAGMLIATAFIMLFVIVALRIDNANKQLNTLTLRVEALEKAQSKLADAQSKLADAQSKLADAQSRTTGSINSLISTGDSNLTSIEHIHTILKYVLATEAAR
jgi:uncharacterized protein YoxC